MSAEPAVQASSARVIVVGNEKGGSVWVSATERRKHRPDGTILNRALETAASNLRIEKVLLQFGLDPTHLTVDAIMDRLIDMGLANINFANTLALVGAILYVATQLMRTIVPLRVVGILSILFFIAYGAMAGAVDTFFLYLLSLPINVIRLRQMLSLIKKAWISAQGNLSMEWLRPFMSNRKCRKGEVLFHSPKSMWNFRPVVSWANSALSFRITYAHKRSSALKMATFLPSPTKSSLSFIFKILNLAITFSA